MIITDMFYNEKIDIWSVGIVLAELLLTVNSGKKEASSQADRYLFEGEQCFPISPNAKYGNVVDKNDQIMKILEKYPNYNQEIDQSFVTNTKQNDYLQNCFLKVQTKQCFSEQFSGINPELVELLQQTLEFNHFYRPSAK